MCLPRAIDRAMVHVAVASLLAVPASPAPASAQALRPAPLVTVRGVVYDSLAGQPLADAFVTLDQTRSTTTDARGRFHFDSVAPGEHALAMQHAALDSAGLTGIATTAMVTDGRHEHAIATPSFASLWRVVCGTGTPPKDSGFVYGTVARASGNAPVAAATVAVSWTDLAAGKTATNGLAVTRQGWHATARTASNGGYGICGVPVDVAIQIEAATDSAASGIAVIAPGGRRVQRRDLLVSLAGDTSAAGRGIIVGVVTDAAGGPFRNARVVMDDRPDVRTGDDGRFVVRAAPAGTRQIEILGVGMAPVVTTVDVTPGDTARVAAQLRRVTNLDVVRVTASRRTRWRVEQYEQRKAEGLGRYMDSTAIARHGTLAGVFRDFAGLQVEGGDRFNLRLRGRSAVGCAPALWVDGFQADYDEVYILRPDDLAAVEVYVSALTVPIRFSDGRTSCGAVAVWTKWMFR